MKRISTKRFGQFMANAEQVTPIDVSGSDSGFNLEVNVSGRTMRVKVVDNGVQLAAADRKVVEEFFNQQRRNYAKHRDVQDPPIKFLQERGLPLYWNREWLANELATLGSYASVAREHANDVNHVAATTIANYARDHFGFKIRERLEDKRREAVEIYEERKGEITQQALADRFNVSISTINRWLRNDSPTYQKAKAKNDDPTKNVYYTRERYEEIKNEIEMIVRRNGGKVNKSQLSRDYNLDRGTISKWVQEFQPPQG